MATALALALCANVAPAAAADAASPAKKPPVADFKLAVAFYGVRKEPITTAELVVHGGVAYYFASEAPQEIVILAPDAPRLELFDFGPARMIRTEIAFSRLEEKQAVLHKAIAGAIRKHEETGTRSDRVAAEMSRSLIDPHLAETFDAAAQPQRLRLTNPAVTVEAQGEPEPDAARLALIANALTALMRLESVRDPEAIPPFIRIDALNALVEGHRLRPIELSFVYRLAGPPRKVRWTYRLADTLTPREVEALRRVTLLRARAPHVSFERYERRAPKPK